MSMCDGIKAHTKKLTKREHDIYRDDQERASGTLLGPINEMFAF